MNESENLRIIKELEKDIQAGNLDGLMSKLAEDVVWNIPARLSTFLQDATVVTSK